MGSTFYPEQSLLECLGLVTEDDPGKVQVATRDLHVRVPRFRHECDRRRSRSSLVGE